MSYGEGVKQDIADNLNLSIEKDSVDHFINNSILERDGFNFEMNSETFENISAVNVDVQVNMDIPMRVKFDGSKFVVLGYNSTYFSNKIQKVKHATPRNK